MPDRMTPEQVATLDAYEWVSRARRGETVPTVEQWEAAERLAALSRNDAHPDSIVAKLANVIAPPKPPPLPEIAPCPYCGGECGCYSAVEHGWDMTGWYVSCQSRGCPYVSPPRLHKPDTIESHNEVARKLRPAKEPRTCGGCKHFDPDPGLLCRKAHYTGGQARVLVRPAVPTRDASECERWEAKP